MNFYKKIIIAIVTLSIVASISLTPRVFVATEYRNYKQVT
ncbi:unnamed protein product, partial [marine sediment metagenome]